MNPPFSFTLTPNAMSTWVWSAIAFLLSLFKAVTLERSYLCPTAACALPGAPVLVPVLLVLGSTCSRMS